MVYTVDLGDEGDHYAKDLAEAWNTLWKWLLHAGSRNIFKLTVTRGCAGVFSNWVSNVRSRSFFQIECCTLVTKKIRTRRGITRKGGWEGWKDWCGCFIYIVKWFGHQWNRLYGFVGLQSKMLEWINGYPLDCYEYQSTCCAKNAFFTDYTFPDENIGSFVRQWSWWWYRGNRRWGSSLVSRCRELWDGGS